MATTSSVPSGLDISSFSKELQEGINQWFKWDKHEQTRKEIEDLVKAKNEKELSKRLLTRIAFGTAGLRGRMQAGFASMNNLTVIQASQGLVKYLAKVDPDNYKTKGVVIGFDGRHNSKSFAEFTAATFLSQGVTVYLISKLSATPLVPYYVQFKGCAAGVMVTASHNPKDDNGYKVYWSNGPQIIPPHDEGIAKCIEENLDPWNIDYQGLLKDNPLLKDPIPEIEGHYFNTIAEKLSFHRELNGQSKLKIVFTPMHGVGKEWVAKSFAAFNIHPYIPVLQQLEPHPDFPTVPFPNPEEGKGALKLGMETADANESHLIIANDPDSDRLAAAEKQRDGKWKIFTGNEIGIILGSWVWSQYREKHPTVDPSKCFVLNTTVSSKMLKAMADKEGLHYEETLTGFKWLGNKADELQKKGLTFIYAYEEAIGYMLGNICLDKDGVRGAAVFAEMANYLDTKGLLVGEYLHQLQQKYGFFCTNNRYFFCYDPNTMEQIFKKIRNEGKYCSSIGPFKVKNIRDLTTGYDNTQPDNKAILPTSTASHMITFFFENGAVGTLRGSGTEPKLKYYFELGGADPVTTQAELDHLVQEMIHQLLEPEKNGLKPPTD